MQGYFYADLILSSTTGDLIFFFIGFFITHSQRRSKRLLQNFSKKAAIL